LISVQDNGSGIELSDMDLVFERYATSKIYGEQDLYTLKSYGFRGEALASISEVSKTSVISKTAYAEIGTKITKVENKLVTRHQPVGFDHGTIVSVEDLFYNVPARLKFLKSSQTEFFYCYNYFVDVALFHYDKHFIFKKNEKVVFDLPKVGELMERVQDVFKKDWSANINDIFYQDEQIRMTGLVSDSQLRFGSTEHMRIYVNSRPVQDKIIRKAIMDAYHRQITPGEYPFIFLMIESAPGTVDVNVHPRKLEVKFADPGKLYDVVFHTVQKGITESRIATASVETSQKVYGSWTPSGQVSGERNDEILQSMPQSS
jgi:DNA mismatch repair protein MutL